MGPPTRPLGRSLRPKYVTMLYTLRKSPSVETGRGTGSGYAVLETGGWELYEYCTVFTPGTALFSSALSTPHLCGILPYMLASLQRNFNFSFLSVLYGYTQKVTLVPFIQAHTH